jgi:hypothetical protein
MRRRFFVAFGLACGLVLAVTSSGPRPLSAAGLELPQRLSDVNFWKLSADWSEANGYFRSDNLTSNELLFQNVVGDLVKRTRPGRVYLGVGPEQNYTYMAAVRPAMAIIFDIRRGNLDLQLMYKALFELASDRADFVSMLFAKPRPAGLTSKSTVVQIFSAFSESATSETLYQQTLKAIDANLTRTHAFPVPAIDLDGIGRCITRSIGPVLPSSQRDVRRTDDRHRRRAAIAATWPARKLPVSEEAQSQNLVIPVVGDFGGPKAIRAVGAYSRRTTPWSARSTSRTSSSISRRTASGRSSARTWRRFRSTPGARSSGRPTADFPASAADPVRSRAWARWPRK